MRSIILEEGKLVEKDIPKPIPKNEEALVRITPVYATPMYTWLRVTGPR